MGRQTISSKFDMFLLLAYYPQTESHFTEPEHSKTYLQTKYKGISALVSVYGVTGGARRVYMGLNLSHFWQNWFAIQPGFFIGPRGKSKDVR